MRLYEGSIRQFRDDVTYNVLAEKIGVAYKNYYRHTASKGEIGAWQQSFNYLKNSFEVADGAHYSGRRPVHFSSEAAR